MARRVLVHLSLAGLVAGAAFSTSVALNAQAPDNWLLSESGATGDADLKLDLAAAERALEVSASPMDLQKRMTKAMGEVLRTHPGKNRLFDAADAPTGAVDVTADFLGLVGAPQVDKPREARLEVPGTPQEPSAPLARDDGRTGQLITVTAPRPMPIEPQASAAAQDWTEAAASIPLVMLTYPSQITPAAEELIDNKYAKSKWPTGCGDWMSSCPSNDNALDQAMVRTAYLIPDVYEALDRAFPGSVVLQPATIDVDARGQLVYKLANPELPAAARLDFMTYVAPRVMGQAPSMTAFTHGLNVLPMFAVTTLHGSKGSKLIALSDGLNPELGRGPTSVLIQLTKTIGTRFKQAPKEISFPTTRWKISDEEWLHVEGAPHRPFMVGSIGKALLPVMNALKRIDREAAARDNLPAYRALYAPELQVAGPLGETLLPVFIKAESEFTRQVTSDFLKGIRSSDLGRSVRKTMIAEREFNKKTRRTQWVAAFTAGMGALAGGLTEGVSALTSPQLLLDAMQQSLTYQQAQQQFASGMSNLAAEQRSVTVQHGSEAVELSGNNIDQFRSEFRKLILSTSNSLGAAPQSDGEGNSR